MPGLVLDQPRHLRAAVPVYRTRHNAEHRSGGVPHIVATDLVHRVGEAIRVFPRLRLQQKHGGCNRIAGNGDDASFLLVHGPRSIGIDHAGYATAVVVTDLEHSAFRAHLTSPSRLRLWDLGVKRRPLGADRAGLHAKADLTARRPIVVRNRVDRHVTGMHPLVAHSLGAGRQHLEIVVAGQMWSAAATGNAHLRLGLLVIGHDILVRQRPIDEAGTWYVTIRGPRLELVWLEAGTISGPMNSRASYGLAGPQWCRPVLGDVARLAHWVEPADQIEHVEVIVLEIGDRVALAGLEDNDIDPFGCKLVCERAAARAGTNDDDNVAVVELEFRHLILPLLLRKPGNVVEAALEIAAVFDRGSLVAEQRPHLRVGVERPHGSAAHRLEELRALDSLNGLEPVPRTELVERDAIGCAELGNTVAKHRRKGGIRRGAGIKRLDRLAIVCVAQNRMWVEDARHAEQTPRCFAIDCVRRECPGGVDARETASYGRCSRDRESTVE